MNDDNKRFSFKKLIARIGSLFMTTVTLLLSCGNNALVAHAAEVSYDKGNTVSFNTVMECEDEDGNRVKTTQAGTITASSEYEIVGYVTSMMSGNKIVRYDIALFQVKSASEIYQLQQSGLSSVTGSQINYLNGDQTSSIDYSFKRIPSLLYYSGGIGGDYKISCSITGCKVFLNRDDMQAYAATGDTSGMIDLDTDISDGEYDSLIGYLHNVQHYVLGYGGLNEYGVYENYTNKFTWDNTYPKYDDSYLVEIKGRYWLQTSGFLGLGKTKEYTSDVRDIVKDICYKDLKVMIDSQYIYDLFEDFREEHNPNKEGSSINWTGCTWRESDFYLRIYRWSDEDNCYHYGKWVNIHFKNSSYDCDVSAGDLDENGNFIVDPDTDYGTGVDQDTKFGEGDDLNDADEDSDSVKDKNTFDLSNASFTDVWNWFTSALAGLISSVGAIPEFFKQIFSFLPNTIYVLIGVGIVIAIILRFLGR